MCAWPYNLLLLGHPNPRCAARRAGNTAATHCALVSCERRIVLLPHPRTPAARSESPVVMTLDPRVDQLVAGPDRGRRR